MKDKDGNKLSGSQIAGKAANRLSLTWTEFVTYFLYLISFLPFSFIRMLFFEIAGMKIGSSSVINMRTRIYNPSLIEIGEDTIVGEGATLDGREKLSIGSHVDIASDVMIYNSEHDIHDKTFKAISAPVVIEDYVFIGPRVVILPGVTIKKGAVVGAGAVVTKDVDAFAVVGGVPAKTIGERKITHPDYRLRRKGLFEIFG